MEVDGIPNVRTENTLLKKGMQVREQNVVGSARFDLMAFMDKLDWLMPAGFYYHMMHKPARLWPFAMRQVRKAAGLGRISPDFIYRGRCDETYPHADVCVVGGGAAGMSAALAAAEKGLRVILLEARPWLGGCFDYRPALYAEDTPLYQRARELAARVTQNAGIRVFTHTPMVGQYSNNLVTAFQKGGRDDAFDYRYIEIRARNVVVASGCIERPLLFENNERPGVMQIGCAQRLARTYGLMPGEKAVFSVGHDMGLEAAVDLCDLGLEVACVADLRQDGHDPVLVAQLAERKIDFIPGWVATRAHGSRGVRKVTIGSIDGTVTRQFDCDLVVASAGLTPVIGPLTLAQVRMGYDAHTGTFLPVELPPGLFTAGRLLGIDDPASIEASGHLAGIQAAAACDAAEAGSVEEARRRLADLPGPQRGSKLVTAPVKGRKSFVCFDEDTTVKNIRQSIEKGFDIPELIKRFSSAGTGPGQGGVPGHNLPLLVAHQQALPPSVFTPTTIRPPLVPVPVAAYAGSNHDMCKRTPVHDSQKKPGAVFRRMGVWRRARYFSDDFGCREEVLNVRRNVGLLDASTLGKFRIHGPDAEKALQRVYIGDMSRMTDGKIKYAAMCNDDGCVIDDGVVVKRGTNDYYFTTSTARAGATIEWFRYHTRYDNWDFHLVNLTDALGVINLAGPNARKVLEKIADTDVSNEAFPFAGYREFTIAGGAVPVRAMRLGFVGELSFEMHVPSSLMQALWDLLETAGESFGIRNFGVEAQNVLRMEKGHLILGQESEQRTNLLDVGLGFLWARNKAEARTVGEAALRHAERDENRLKLVGIKMEDPRRAPREGALVVDQRIRGHVCTARRSFTLEEAVGMALVEAPLAGIGNRLEIFEDECEGNLLAARVAPMPFYDPDGKRMRM
jgi:sarcosine oxidase subunit alpha